MEIILILIYIFLCMVAGYMGRNKRLGYWGFFFCSILFTPFISLLFMYFTMPIKKDDDDEE